GIIAPSHRARKDEVMGSPKKSATRRVVAMLAAGAALLGLAAALYWLPSAGGRAGEPAADRTGPPGQPTPTGAPRPALPEAKRGPGPHDVGGAVLDGAGAGLPGLAVSAFREEGGEPGAEPVASAHTDEAGRFTLAGLPAGRFRFAVAGPDIF